VADWLRSVTGRVPTLLVLDDLHWATRPTLQLLRHLVHVLDAVPLLIVAAYRDTEARSRVGLEEVLGDLHRVAGIERTSLAGITAGEVVELLESGTRRTLAPSARALARAVRAETGGNPFFARQFLRHLIDNGTLITDPHGRWTVETVTEPFGVPAGVREVMARRLGRMSEETLRVLEVAAVVGTEFELSVVAAALDADEDTVLAGLEDAVAARLIVEVAPYRFRFAHALVGSSILDGMARARRNRMHRKVAEAIERVHADTLEEHFTVLARQYSEAAASADADRAVDYAIRAGEAARLRLAHEEASACYQLAVDLLSRHHAPDEHRRRQLLVRLGEEQRLAGDPAHRATLLEATRLAVAAGDAELAAEAALANRRARIGVVALADVERVDALEATVALQPGADSPTLARLLAHLAFELAESGDWPRRLALSDRAWSMARRLDDPATLAEVLILRGDTIARPDTLAERLTLAEKGLALAEQAGDPALTVGALLSGIICGFESGRVDLVDEWLDRALRLTEQLSQPSLRWQVMQQRVKQLTITGRFAEASVAAGETFELGQEASDDDAPLVFTVEHFVLSTFQGRWEEVEPLIGSMVVADVQIPALLAAQARLRAEAGDIEAGRGLLEKALVDGLDWLPDDPSRLTLAALVALTAYLLDMPEAAGPMIPVLEPYHEQVAADRTVCGGSVAHYLGLACLTLGELDDAERWLSEAIDIHRRMGARPFMAFTQYDLARTLDERGWPGDRPRLRVLVDEARATAEELGMPVLARDAALLAERNPL
jgi:tetratricopeptide (TPR) repeat protein